MMHALMHWEHTNYTLKTKNWLEHRVYIKKKKKKKTPNFENPLSKS